MTRFKHLLWDIDGTLLNFELAESQAIRQGFEHFKLGHCSEEQLAVYAKINQEVWLQLERGEATRQQILLERFLRFFDAYGIDPELADDFNYYYQEALGHQVVFNPHALEVVKTCQEDFIQLAVTNGTRRAQEIKLKKSGLDQIFDGIYISEDQGVDKPDPAFFQAVFDQYGEERDSYLIIGDSLTSDMQGGVNVGIKTCWYNPQGKVNTSPLDLDYEIEDLREVLKIFIV